MDLLQISKLPKVGLLRANTIKLDPLKCFLVEQVRQAIISRPQSRKEMSDAAT